MEGKNHPTREKAADSVDDNSRQARKQQTKTALAEAAFSLIAEGGANALTAERIAVRAGVSRRTFFNHYDSVEYALEGIVSEFFEDLTRQLHAASDDVGLFSALRAMTEVPVQETSLERFSILAAAANTNGSLRGFLERGSDLWQEQLVAFIEQRDPGGDPVQRRLLAAALVAISREVTDICCAASTCDVDDSTTERHRLLFLQALGYLESGFCRSDVEQQTDDFDAGQS